MQQIKIIHNDDGTYTATIDGKEYKLKDTNELHQFLEAVGI